MADNIPVTRYRKDLSESFLPYKEFRYEGGESLLEVWERASGFIEELLSRHLSNETILISAHHSLNKALIFNLLNLPWSEWKDFHQRNCCINEIYSEGDRWLSECVNNTEHLD